MTVEDSVSVPLPPLRTFRIRRDFYLSERIDGALPIEGIEAHHLQTGPDGTVTFYRYLRAYLTGVGTAYDYRIERQLAPGTYFDITELTDTFTTAPAN